MYTGIVQGIGRVRSLENGVFKVAAPEGFAPNGFDIGESLSVNGCCLTVIDDTGLLKFDVSPETLARTSLGDLVEGSVVNLERPMSADGRFGGHMVQGHVDTTGTIVSITPSGNAVVYRFQAPLEYDRYLIDKGSIAIDGISLTVVKPQQGQFDVWVIPHTLEMTNLGVLNVGSRVNLEFDMVARYIEKLLAATAVLPSA